MTQMILCDYSVGVASKKDADHRDQYVFLILPAASAPNEADSATEVLVKIDEFGLSWSVEGTDSVIRHYRIGAEGHHLDERVQETLRRDGRIAAQWIDNKNGSPAVFAELVVA